MASQLILKSVHPVSSDVVRSCLCYDTERVTVFPRTKAPGLY